MGTFTEKEYVVTETSTGFTFTRNGGAPVTVYIPNYSSLGLSVGATGTWHQYAHTFKVGTTSQYPNFDALMNSLRSGAAPEFDNFTRLNDPVTNGSQTNVAFGLGGTV